MIQNPFTKSEIKKAKRDYKKSLANPTKHNEEKKNLVLHLINSIKPHHNIRVVLN